jgi:hypothetical protein
MVHRCFKWIARKSLLENITDVMFLSKISFGGIATPRKSESSQRKNFLGCLENINFNGDNIIDMAKRHRPQVLITVRAAPSPRDRLATLA